MAKKIQKHWFLSIFFLIIGIGFFLNPRFAYAVSCDANSCDGVGDRQQCLADTIDSCSDLISQKQQEKRSLNTTISIINGNIAIQQLQINQTLYQINVLQGEVQELTERIGGLNISLDRLSSILVERVGEQYKRTQVDPIFLLFKGNSLNNFLSEYKYIKLAKKQTLEAMHRAESQRLIYDEQKNLKEQKQQELEAIERKLEAQRVTLANQKQEKENLLAITKHDESRYQQLLNEAERELAARRTFVFNIGGASILNNQTKCDDWGCYYNQRDSLWGNMAMGNYFNDSVAEIGCFITSVSMMASHQNISIKPNNIAQTPDAFATYAPLLNHSFTVNGINVSITKTYNMGTLDSELAAGRSIIAELNGGAHFIVIVKKDGDKYIMHDPVMENGSYKNLNDTYSISNITSLRLVSFH